MSLRLTWFRGCSCPVASAWFAGRGAVQGGLPRQRRPQAHGRGWWQLGARGESLRLEMVLFLFFLRCILALPCGWYILIYYSSCILIDSTCAAADDTFLSWEYRMRDLCWVVRSLPTTTQQSQWVEVSRKQKTLLRKQKNTVNTCTTVTKVVTHMQLSWRVGLMRTFNSVQDTPTLDLYRHDSAQQWQMLFFFLLGPSKDTLARWPNPLFGGRWRWHTTNASFKLWQLLH